jgi:ribosomal protein L28
MGPMAREQGHNTGWASRLKSGNAYYHSVQIHSSSGLLCKDIKIKIYRSIMLPVLHGYETWSLTLREERRLRVSANRVLRRISGSTRDEVSRERR